jgi:ABC-type bacteriocin/lantibiotic exporter with double-glycine peptidase domain
MSRITGLLSHPPSRDTRLWQLGSFIGTQIADVADQRKKARTGKNTETMRMAGPADIELAAVTKLYGSTTAVDSIDLKIPAGTYCCLLGPSGCGKTSTLRMIAGHETVSDGDILLGDTHINDLPPARRGTAMMFQSRVHPLVPQPVPAAGGR